MAGTNGDRLSEIRDILRDIAERQRNLAERQDRFQSQIEATQNLTDSNARSIEATQNLANSNARSIQAWEALIEQNRIEAEEERSQLRVELNELKQASRENIRQHFEFMNRFDQVLGEIQQIWRRLAG